MAESITIGQEHAWLTGAPHFAHLDRLWGVKHTDGVYSNQFSMERRPKLFGSLNTCQFFYPSPLIRRGWHKQQCCAIVRLTPVSAWIPFESGESGCGTGLKDCLSTRILAIDVDSVHRCAVKSWLSLPDSMEAFSKSGMAPKMIKLPESEPMKNLRSLIDTLFVEITIVQAEI